jgi:hypothetical protein
MRSGLIWFVFAVAVGGVASPAVAGPHHTKPPVIDVTGTYTGTYGEVRLSQHGTHIEGDYVCCGGGTIEGRIVGRVIKFHWAQSDGADGDGEWRVITTTTLEGTWGSGESADDGGTWNLERSDSIAN